VPGSSFLHFQVRTKISALLQPALRCTVGIHDGDCSLLRAVYEAIVFNCASSWRHATILAISSAV